MRAGLLRAATVATFAAGTLLATTTPAQADGEWLRVNPTTITAGFSVTIEASCGTNVNPAKVSSEAFGEQLMLPQHGTNYLYAIVTIPLHTRARGYTVTLTCVTTAKATTTLWVVTGTEPSKGPNTGGGGLAMAGGNGGTAVLVGGLGTLGVGAALGLVALRRRRASAG